MTLFTIGSHEFGWEEVAAAARIWGEWDRFVERVRHSLACFHLATRTDQLPSAARMGEVATAFRYERNLISGEETRAWLLRWDITVEEWMNCLRAQVLRQGWAGRLVEIESTNPIGDDEIADAIKRHAVCSGKLEDWTQRLAGRAAVAAISKESFPETSSPDELVAIVEAEFERRKQSTITTKLMATKIADNRLDWIHYDCRYLWFEDESVGREAVWCVREDGLTLDEVAASACSDVQEWSFYGDEIDESIRPAFLAARPGDLLGPLKLGTGYPLFSLVDKRPPKADDPQILMRAEEAIITSLVSHAINEQVKWTDDSNRYD